MKLTQLYNEIKVEKPNSHFIVIPKGKEMCKDYNDWWVLGRKIGVNDLQFEIAEVETMFPILFDLLILHIYSDLYGEGIIKFNERNNIELCYKNQKNTLGYSENEFQNHLELFKNEGWIKII